MTLWRRFCADQRGNMVVMFAAGFVVASVVAAIAVDAAGLYHERRGIQNGVDLAALAAANNPAAAQSVAYSALMDAGLMRADSQAGLTVVTGNYNPDPAVAVESRFVVNATPTNAVQVSFSKPGTLHFANCWAEPPTLGATAIATVTPQVAFSVGSRLASVKDGLANAVLNKLLGTNIELTALDYNGLVNAKVDLFAFLDQLAIKLGVSVGTYNDLLAMRADHGQLAAALADLLTGAQRTAMLALANTAGNNGTVPIGKLLQLGQLGDFDIGTGAANGLFTKISALDLLSASAAISDGTHQVSAELPLKLGETLIVELKLAIGEPPQGGSWYAIGPAQTVVRTAQVRLSLVIRLKLKLLLDVLAVNLPLYVQVAHSEASVASATCPIGTNVSGSAVINARPGAAKIVVGEVANFGSFDKAPIESPANLLVLLGIPITAFAQAEIAQLTPVPLSFSPSEIAADTVKTAKTTTILGSLLGSLLGNLQLGGLLGLGSVLSAVLVPALDALLTPLAAPLDPILSGLLDALGVSIGEADVQVYGVRCTQPVLVG
ncbi:putative membrane protein [Devosia sp. LC5]|uniref:TadG family pilus assembly protein n=1 Tax=Devosia sp. LC5 TaxID=1502724 RepID=UPI0004E3F5F6|nr:TadG family pilus assembly protein [Devosia sp. LC5]KFC61357.1 putative membrane protein [Devosia sp. LC5]